MEFPHTLRCQTLGACLQVVTHIVFFEPWSAYSWSILCPPAFYCGCPRIHFVYSTEFSPITLYWCTRSPDGGNSLLGFLLTPLCRCPCVEHIWRHRVSRMTTGLNPIGDPFMKDTFLLVYCFVVKTPSRTLCSDFPTLSLCRCG